MSDEAPINLTVLGRMIGTSTGWDQADTETFQFYDFKPADGISIPACENLIVSYGDGIASASADDGTELFSLDLVDLLKTILPAKGA